MNINLKKQTSKDIDLLSRKDSIFVLDFRATGEALNYEIPAMWKYENLLTHILNNQTVVVNEDYKELDLIVENNYLVASKTKDKPSKSVLSRIEKDKLSEFKSIINFIPHPDFDKYAKESNTEIFYKFDDFLKFNNKVDQKKQLDNLTPKWDFLDNSDDKRIKTHYVKASVGSGGYKVFSPGTFDTQVFEDASWYLEEKCDGEPMSAQILKEGFNYTVFGLTKQKVEEDRYFIGAEVISLKENLNTDLKTFLEDVIERLSKLLDSYEGFWGIDFIETSENKYSFLEANIRLTAMTIPTLVVNERFESGTGLFMEDVEEVKDGDFVMSVDKSDNLFDTLRETN